MTFETAEHAHCASERHASADVTLAVHARWSYDAARWPDDYPDVPLGSVTHETADIVVLHDDAGDVLTRYRVRSKITHGRYETQAYAALVEL